MPSQVHQRGPTKPQMNITPLIDVVFLLIIFFMLVNNIITEQSVRMIVPTLEDATTREFDKAGRLIVNIAPMDYNYKERVDNPLLFDGEARFIRVGLQTFDADDLQGVTDALIKARQAAEKQNRDLNVVLRSDGALYYSVVQPVMSAITRAGIDSVNLVAYMPEHGVGSGEAEASQP